YLTAIVVEYTEGDPETYVLPLEVATGERVAQVQKDFPQAVVARLRRAGEEAVLYEVLWDTRFCDALLTALLRRRRFSGEEGELRALPTRRFRHLYDQSGGNLPASLMHAEQSNTSILYGTTFLLKLFRRVASGVNPDLEIGHFLTDTAAFPHVPAVAGALE